MLECSWSTGLSGGQRFQLQQATPAHTTHEAYPLYGKRPGWAHQCLWVAQIHNLTVAAAINTLEHWTCDPQHDPPDIGQSEKKNPSGIL